MSRVSKLLNNILLADSKLKAKIENNVESVKLKNVFAIVEAKDQSIITVRTTDAEYNGNKNIDLNGVTCTFVPIVGDHIKLFVHNGTEISEITAFETKVHKGDIKMISKTGHGYGIIDEAYVFYDDILDTNTKLMCGDVATCEIIRGDFDVGEKQFKWRCTTIKLHSQKSLDNNRDVSDLLCDEDDDGEFKRKCNAIKKNLASSVRITEDINLKIVFDDSPRKCRSLRMNVLNRIDESITITQVLIVTDNDALQIVCLNRDVDQPCVLQKNEKIVYELQAQFTGAKANTFAKVFFHFSCGGTLTRTIQIDHEKQNEGRPMFNLNKLLARVEYYNIPAEFIALESKSKAESWSKLNELVPSTDQLNMDTYAEHFHGLLYLEEMGMLKHFQKYKQDKAFFQPERDLFALEMKANLFELRPSISVGDSVTATKINTTCWHKGIIQEVGQNYLMIRFNEEFIKNFNYEDYSVEFSFSRLVFIRKHSAVDAALNIFNEQMLFPTQLNEKEPQLDVHLNGKKMMRDDEEIPWINNRHDKYQKKAVMQILRGECRLLPYIIYGPPGTGKTSVLVETILQLFTYIKDCRILITAQSNSAVNLISSRLIESGLIDTNDMLQIVSHNSIKKKNIQKELLPYSASIFVNFDTNSAENESPKTLESGLKINCSVEYVKNFRLVVATCMSLGSLMRTELASNFFTHAIIDEAGQCIEPEALIAMTFVSKDSGQIVMAGDPNQLEPLVMTSDAKNRGLQQSMLNRLLNCYLTIENTVPEQDQMNIFDPRLVIKLRNNYRALPSVLQFYNKQFYDSVLNSTISKFDSPEAKLLSLIRRSGILAHSKPLANDFGIYFVDVNGKNQRLRDSPSWCNAMEARQISSFVPKLLQCGISQQEIGIITPYHLQAVLLKKYLENFEGIRIGSVEQFQGQERKVVLISTVRTNGSRLLTDLNRNLGFVRCPKRINVAVSRARMLVVVYGMADLLVVDTNWKQLIDDCKEHGTFESSLKITAAEAPIV